MRRRQKPLRGESARREKAAHLAVLLQRRRERGREFMRRWRADPEHREVERERRDAGYVQKKVRSAERLRLRPYTGIHGQPLCGFCGLGRPVEIVERLRISQDCEEEYIKVFVPYCGHC
jgi:hypothetical protein